MASSDHELWIQVRIRRPVHERLTAYAASLNRLPPDVRGDLGEGHRGPVSLGDAVERLLDMRDAHRERSRKHARVSGRGEGKGESNGDSGAGR